MTEEIRLVLACGDYDRTRALHAGTIATPGLDLQCLALPAAETFVRMTSGDEFDVGEFSASMYAIGLARGDDRFIAVPVFPLRAFRHRDIYVCAAGDVTDPAALIGQRVGLRHFHMTSAVWQRGMLTDDFGVRTEQMRWVRAELSTSSPVTPRLTLRLPESIELTTERGASLVDLLLAGSIAAAFVARPVDHPGVRRLFIDPAPLERDYFGRAGYPIMHVLAVRRHVVERHPQLPRLLVQAFEDAKRAAYCAALGSSSPSILPFATLDMERAQAQFGRDLYPYGLTQQVRRTLDTLRRYLIEQHLAPGVPPVSDWFELTDPPGELPIGEGFQEIED